MATLLVSDDNKLLHCRVALAEMKYKCFDLERKINTRKHNLILVSETT